MPMVGPAQPFDDCEQGISAGLPPTAYRGLVQIGRKAVGAKDYSQCGIRMLIGDQRAAAKHVNRLTPLPSSRTRRWKHKKPVNLSISATSFFATCRATEESAFEAAGVR